MKSREKLMIELMKTNFLFSNYNIGFVMSMNDLQNIYEEIEIFKEN